MNRGISTSEGYCLLTPGFEVERPDLAKECSDWVFGSLRKVLSGPPGPPRQGTTSLFPRLGANLLEAWGEVDGSGDPAIALVMGLQTYNDVRKFGRDLYFPSKGKEITSLQGFLKFKSNRLPLFTTASLPQDVVVFVSRSGSTMWFTRSGGKIPDV